MFFLFVNQFLILPLLIVIIGYQAHDRHNNIAQEEERLLERMMIFIADLNQMLRMTKQIYQA